MTFVSMRELYILMTMFIGAFSIWASTCGICHYHHKSIFDSGVTIILGTLAMIFMVTAGLSGILTHNDIVKNHINEPYIYAETLADYDSIINAFNNAQEDVVKTDLYTFMINYNNKITEYRARFNDPQFRHNFSGDYDWNTVPLIVLKEG